MEFELQPMPHRSLPLSAAIAPRIKLSHFSRPKHIVGGRCHSHATERREVCKGMPAIGEHEIPQNKKNLGHLKAWCFMRSNSNVGIALQMQGNSIQLYK